MNKFENACVQVIIFYGPLTKENNETSKNI